MGNNRLLEKKERRSYLSCEDRPLSQAVRRMGS